MEINKIYQGNCLEVLKSLPDNNIDCCITSPPYFGLRDYGTAKWEGGDVNCNHTGHELLNAPGSDKQASNKGANYVSSGDCIKCGAIRIDEQIGLEETPELYVSKLVDVFTEVKRVLKKDATLWLNLGDSYAATTKGTGGKTSSTLNAKRNENGELANDRKSQPFMNEPIRFDLRLAGLKPKDLIGIPWMVAFALRSSGWYLRQDIIWHKPNPMPESVTDRCTKSHEYIFLLSKSQKYYYDAEAIQELAAYDGRKDTVMKGSAKYSIPTIPGSDAIQSMALNGHERWKKNEAGEMIRNKRSVWTVNTYPYSDAHFATFPQELITDMIKAGCPENGIVLDPFSGAGTTALVAAKLNRNFIGIELNPDYIKITENRLQKELGMFNTLNK